MKKIIAAMLFSIASSTAFAQTEKGTQNIGLSFSFQTSSRKINNNQITDEYFNTGNAYSSYSTYINYGYFIADKLDVNVSAGYAHSKYETKYSNSNNSITTTNAFTTGLQLRKYLLFNDKFGIRTGPGFFYTYGKSKDSYSSSDSNQEQTTNEYTGNLSLDFVFYPIKNLGISSTLGNINYTHTNTTGYNAGSSNSFQTHLVNNLNLGFFYSW